MPSGFAAKTYEDLNSEVVILRTLVPNSDITRKSRIVIAWYHPEDDVKTLTSLVTVVLLSMLL